MLQIASQGCSNQRPVLKGIETMPYVIANSAKSSNQRPVLKGIETLKNVDIV